MIKCFIDLVENRKFFLIKQSKANLEQIAKEMKATEVSNPKINPKSEKIAMRKSSGPRVDQIINKGLEYQKKKIVKQEEE